MLAGQPHFTYSTQMFDWPTRNPFMSLRALSITLTMFVLTTNLHLQAEEKPPVSPEAKRLSEIKILTSKIKVDLKNVNLYSRRGDAYFYSGQFNKAVADYSKMVELDPRTDTSHWRRGIAYFYTEEFDKAAAQFDRYHSFDSVDRENGIWRYLSHYQSNGKEAARKELLKYDKDDREPFGDVYQLFAGTMTAEQILLKIKTAEISDSEREKRYFYALLYVGLNDAVEGRAKSAKKHLTQAAENTWAPKAGYGPHYMWEVARLHALKFSK